MESGRECSWLARLLDLMEQSPGFSPHYCINRVVDDASEVLGYPQLRKMPEASLGYMKPCLKI